MAKVKRVVRLVKIKRPPLKKGGAVAKRAVKKPFKSKKQQNKPEKATQPATPIKSGRIRNLADRKRKKEADKERRHKSVLTRQGRSFSLFFARESFLDDDRDLLLSVTHEEEITVTVRRTEHCFQLCDSNKGDSGLPED